MTAAERYNQLAKAVRAVLYAAEYGNEFVEHTPEWARLKAMNLEPTRDEPKKAEPH